MITRILTALLGLPLVIYLLFFAPARALLFAMALVSVIAVYEIAYNTKLVTNPFILAASLLAAALVPYAASSGARYLISVILGYMLASGAILVFTNHRAKFSEAAYGFFAAVAISLSFASVYFLKIMENGAILVALPFLGAWASDTFAYFTGMTIGRHKLCPELSPKKTVEGAVGGVLGAVLVFLLFGYLCSANFGVRPTYYFLALSGALTAVAGQLGDLFASIIKRETRIKDFGTILPGHGGICDRFDSVMFTAPLFYIAVQLLGIMMW